MRASETQKAENAEIHRELEQLRIAVRESGRLALEAAPIEDPLIATSFELRQVIGRS
jgi:hypothetical protein